MRLVNPTRLVNVITKHLFYHYSQNQLSDKTKVNYQCRFNNIVRYLTEEDYLSIDIKEVNQSFTEGLHFWMIERYDLTEASKTIDLIKGAVNYALAKGYVSSNPLLLLKTKQSKPKEVIHCNKQELDLIYNYVSKLADRIKARDLYLIQAYSGMSYGDIWHFKLKEEDGIFWLFNTRIKTKKEYWVPVDERFMEIYNKYNGKLPYLSNIDYNRAIKLVARDLKINKRLTTHTARKTFATQMHEKQWSNESIADMMGISLQVLNTYYIKKTKNRVANELLKRNLYHV